MRLFSPLARDRRSTVAEYAWYVLIGVVLITEIASRMIPAA